jgi:mono/diheme cytochrome c family protein/cytochrome c553
MKKYTFSLLLLLAFVFFRFVTPEQYDENTPLYAVLLALEEVPPKHTTPYTSPVLVAKGEALVKKGRFKKENGLHSNYISKHYVCTSCHTLEQEDPNLRYSDPDTRLAYVKSKNLPFLQGSTFFGMVNRETWYNDDYVTKYGDLAVKAHNDLIESIQLCAEVCSQGRRLDDEELTAILAYVWSLEYKLGDLGLKEADYQRINSSANIESERVERIKWLKSFYALKSPATFVDAPPDKKLGYADLTGRPEVGKDIYELSCKNCHHENGESNLILDNSRFTFRKLKRNLAKDGHFSIYQIIRYGTHPIEGHRPYMPHYTLERMSHQQVEDLRAYIEQQAS